MFDLYNGGGAGIIDICMIFFFLFKELGRGALNLARHWAGVNNETIEENGFNRQ